MSQRSRRFLASKEASVLHTAFDHRADPQPVATLRTMSEKGPYSGTAGVDEADSQEVERQVDTHGIGVLDTARQQIFALAGKLVQWGREHPVRMAGAAAVFIAASGLLVQSMRKRARRIAAARQAVKQVKTRIKSRVRDTMEAVGRTARKSGRAMTAKSRSSTRGGMPAMAGSSGRRSR
jgi:hypothetical protein